MDELNEKIEGLVKKAEKSGMPYGILKKVYDRGMAAWRTGHRPGTTPQQWAFARVNSFVTKSSGTWGGADKDLAKQVRGEEVEKRKTAKDMIGQVKEKLGKDADAGDFIKDFRKSKAPQFKGKSDKKIQKMAIAAYLDSKEEEVEESLVKESGHEDVASMKTQVQIAMDALQKMNMELGKLSDEDNLPTWWTNKVSTAVSKLDGMADYIDAKHDQGQRMNEDNITEEKVFVVRFEKEGMRFAVPFSDMKRAKDGEKILKKSAGVSNVSVTKDILKPGVSMSKFRTRQEGRILPESKMGELFLDMQMDAQEMSERDFIKTYSRQGFQAAELKRLFKQFNEEVVKEAVAQNDAFVVTGGPGDNAQKVIAVFKDKGNGLKDAKKARDDYNKKNNPTKPSHKARIYRQTRLSQAGKRFKPGEKIMYSTFGNKQQFTKLKEDMKVEHPMVKAAALATSVWAEKRHVDPADIDVKATAADRKAADKNIIIQLRRAQDMVKQTGRQDQTGIEFLDKKKQKVDSKVINKALDMFDRMKPNDKQKMQQSIGKSYRDLLKTVQRGRV